LGDALWISTPKTGMGSSLPGRAAIYLGTLYGDATDESACSGQEADANHKQENRE